MLFDHGNSKLSCLFGRVKTPHGGWKYAAGNVHTYLQELTLHVSHLRGLGLVYISNPSYDNLLNRK